LFSFEGAVDQVYPEKRGGGKGRSESAKTLILRQGWLFFRFVEGKTSTPPTTKRRGISAPSRLPCKRERKLNFPGQQGIHHHSTIVQIQIQRKKAKERGGMQAEKRISLSLRCCHEGKKGGGEEGILMSNSLFCCNN